MLVETADTPVVANGEEQRQHAEGSVDRWQSPIAMPIRRLRWYTGLPPSHPNLLLSSFECTLRLCLTTAIVKVAIEHCLLFETLLSESDVSRGVRQEGGELAEDREASVLQGIAIQLAQAF